MEEEIFIHYYEEFVKGKSYNNMDAVDAAYYLLSQVENQDSLSPSVMVITSKLEDFINSAMETA